MKKITRLLPLIFLAFVSAAFAQEKTADWIRVQSENGEFSIEVPARHSFFYDKDGFTVSENGVSFEVKEMNMLNAYTEKTLVSFESYKANKKALEIMRKFDDKKGKSSESKRENYSIRQIVIKTDNSYTVRQYFNSKDYIYILTAASRQGETQTLNRFLNSLVFNPNAPEKDPKAIRLADLKISTPELDPNPPPVKPADNSAASKTDASKDETTVPLIILIKNFPAFTDAARSKGTTGVIKLRPTFSADGSITKIELNKTLGEGLLRQAVFALLRTKFLPEEKNGEPQPVTKMVEYSFSRF